MGWTGGFVVYLPGSSSVISPVRVCLWNIPPISFGYVPVLEPWPLDPPRPTINETLDTLREEVEETLENMQESDTVTESSKKVVPDIFPSDYKDRIYDNEWTERGASEVTYFFRRLGVGAFVALYIAFGTQWSDRVSGKVKLPLTYDPDKIAAYFKLRPEKVAMRSIRITCVAVNHGLGVAYDNASYNLAKDFKAYKYLVRKVLRRVGIVSQLSPQQLEASKARYLQEQEYWEDRFQRRAGLLRESITELGPAFVKIGQLLASRPDIVGNRLVKELNRLQDDLPFFENEEAFNFIREEIGADPDRVFNDLSERPVAAASLGQVYKAKLDGIDIAVKVQRPGIVETIALDFFILRKMGHLLGLYLKSKSNPSGLIDDYALRLFEELDYARESQNMEKFRSLYGSIEGIYVPQVFSKYSTRHVLVMEWVNGEKLVDESAHVDPEDIPLVEVGIRCSLTQMLEVGFLHADPHAGNLIRTEKGRLAYLDFGLVCVVPESIRTAILCAILHLINREYELLAEDFASMSIIQAFEMDLELAEFSKVLMDKFEPLMAGGTQNFTFIGVTEQLLSLSTQFPLVFPSYFVNNMRALATLEGLGLTADPNFKIFRIIYPYVAKRVLYDSNPVLKRALEEMVVDEDGGIRWNRLETMVSDADTVGSAGLGLREATGTSSENAATLAATTSPRRSALRGWDSLVAFVTSPGGRSLRRIFVRQIIDDLVFRFERWTDNIEEALLPEVLRPPERCTGVCTDVQYILRLKESRRRSRMLFTRFRRYSPVLLFPLIPMFLVNTVYILGMLLLRMLLRLVQDFLFILTRLVRLATSLGRSRGPQRNTGADMQPAPVAARGTAGNNPSSSPQRGIPFPTLVTLGRPVQTPSISNDVDVELRGADVGIQTALASSEDVSTSFANVYVSKSGTNAVEGNEVPKRTDTRLGKINESPEAAGLNGTHDSHRASGTYDQDEGFSDTPTPTDAASTATHRAPQPLQQQQHKKTPHQEWSATDGSSTSNTSTQMTTNPT